MTGQHNVHPLAPDPADPAIRSAPDSGAPDAPDSGETLSELFAVTRALVRDVVRTASLELDAARLALMRLFTLGAVAVALAIATLFAVAGTLTLLLNSLGLNLALSMALTALLFAGVCALVIRRMLQYAKLLEFPAFSAILRDILGVPDE